MRCCYLWGWLLLTSFPAWADVGPRPEVQPGVVVVKLHAPITPQAGKTGLPAVDTHLRSAGVTAIVPAFPFLERAGRKRPNPALERLRSIYLVYYESPISPWRLAAELEQLPEVVYAEPLFRREIIDTPNDSLYSQMTHLAQIMAPQAWDVVKGENGNVVIAIVDGGTDWRHEDLVGNVWVNPGEIPGNGIDDDGNGFVDDVHGWNFANNTPDPTGLPTTPLNAAHGTQVAGVAAAVTNNGRGVAGSSWNARFMPINSSCPDADRSICFGYMGIVYAAENGAQVINVSWGGRGLSRLENDVVHAVTDMGALIVAAAGNDATSNDRLPFGPASHPRVLSVGATQKNNDLKASFSNYGLSVNVFAPGVSLNTTLPGNRYTGAASGTSFATPLAAGIAALVRTRFPNYTPDQAREQLRQTADPIDAVNPGFAGLLGRGRINAYRAVTESGFPAIRLVRLEVSDEDGDGYLESGEIVQLTASFTNFLALATGVRVELQSNDPYLSLQQRSQTLGTLNPGDTATATFSLTIASNAPNNHLALLQTRTLADGGYVDADLIRLTVNPEQVARLTTSRIETAITTTGNIGWTGFADESPGVGFRLDGRNLLFEGGLVTGSSSLTVSDAVRGADGSTQQRDFELAPGSSLEVSVPGAFAYQQGSVELVDSRAPRPLPIRVIQETYADSAQDNQLFVLFRYDFVNIGNAPIAPFYGGVFLDWDLNLDARDFARFDAARQMGIVQNRSLLPDTLAAIRLLTPAPFSYRAINNEEEIYDGFTEEEKWTWLSGGMQRQELDRVDVSQLMAIGPFRIGPGCQVSAAFALLAASSEAALTQAADAAQRFWRERIAPSIPNRPPQWTHLPDTLRVLQNRSHTVRLTATDPDACASLNYRLLTAPPGVTLDPLEGTLTIVAAIPPGSYPIQAMVSDGLAADTARLTLIVEKLPTFLTLLPDTTILVGQTLTFHFQANNAESAVTFELVEGPTGAQLDPNTGLFTYTATTPGRFGLVVALQVDTFRVESPRITIEVVPGTLQLQVYPQPGRAPLTVLFDIPEAQPVRLILYDLLGRQLRRLIEGSWNIGRYRLTWDGRSEDGAEVAPGLYFLRLEMGDRSVTRPLVYMR